MDPRSIQPGFTAVQNAGTGIFHPTMIHPRTGLPLEAVGVVNGKILWPIMGAAEKEEDPDIDKDAEDSADDDDEDEKGEEDDEDEDDDEKDAKARIKALEEEKERHYRRRKKAEKERDELKAENEKLKAGKKPPKKVPPKKADDADVDEDEDDEEKTTLRNENEKAKETTRKLKVENAFLRVNAVDWVNPAQVMTLLMADDDYEVEFDDRDNVDRKSLSAELKRFAKANPHLVKPKPKKSEDDDDSGNDSSGKSSGSTMNGQRKGKKKVDPTREQLAAKYPALGL